MIRIAFFTAAILCASASFAAEIATNAAPRVQNEEQRQRLREANETFRGEQAALYDRLRAARRELDQAAQAEIPDEKNIRAKAAALGQIEGDLAILRARHFKELRAIFSDGIGTNISPRLLDLPTEHPNPKSAVTIPSGARPLPQPPADSAVR